MASAASTVMATEPDIGLEETQSPEDHVHASRAVIVRAPRMEEETFDSWESFFACLDYWTRQSRSKGKRRGCFENSTGCEAHMSVAVAWCATRGFHVKITHQNTTHNHTLGSGSYGNHPSARCVQDENGIAFVDELQAAGLKKNPILQFLRKKTGKRITLRDIHNLVAKLKEARHGPTSVKKNWNAGLREFCTL
ncbi:hypothetical protein PC128_g11706 [Phytophthora cactorum]|nr:hypothetical protein PC128_g11706 [Phytophthora cactorum]